MLVTAGTTDFSTYMRLRNSDGSPATGLTLADFDLEYVRTRTAAVINDANALGAANSTHADWGMFEVSTGLYRIDVPDAAFASGVPEVVVSIRHASILEESRSFQIVAFNVADGVRMGLTALPNANSNAPGGLPVSVAGGLDLDKINDILADTGTDGVLIANGGITPATIQDGAITAAKFAANALTASALAADAVSEIQSGLATAASIVTLGGHLDAIKAKTDNLPTDPADQSLIIDATDAIMNRLGPPTGASVSADIASVQTDTNDIQSRLPPTLTAGGNMRSDVLALNGDTTAAANIAKTTRAIARGTVNAGATTTSIPTSAFSPAGAATDQFKGRIITFDADTATAALRGQCTDIVNSSNAATPALTVTALTTAPTAGDTFSVT